MAEQMAAAITLPDGTLIRGRGRREQLPAGPLPDFGLYLGRPPDQPRRGLFPHRRGWQPDWPADWIDWPDFRTPRHDQLAAATIEHAYLLARAGQRVEVACWGGTGRTGTVIACMAILAGQPVEDAVTWTRHHYRPRAVETPSQRRWIRWFATHAHTS
ncbi:MAG: protein-tyrosine phosphatase family protein [Pseudonocardiaceae bacterium]